MRKIYVWFCALVLAIMAGCSSLGLVQPKTFEERYAYAIATNASVRVAAAQAVTSKAITPETGRTILKGTDNARALLDESLNLVGTDAELNLHQALLTIENLMKLLKSNGVEVPGL